MIPRDRLEYSPIEGRAPLRWPDGVRLVTLNARVCETYPPVVKACVDNPYLSGAPHRARHVERAFRALLDRRGVVAWDGAEILDWYLSFGG
jgi:hypothetical protein